MSNTKSKIFRYKEDITPVSVVSICFLLSIYPIFIKLNIFILIINWFLALTLKNAAIPAQHNHAHLKVFKNSILNFIYDIILVLTTGYSTPEWELQHNLGHHKHYMIPEKDPASTIDAKTNKKMSVSQYIIQGSLRIFPDALRIGLNEKTQGKNKLYNRLITHLLIQLVLTSILLYLNLWVTFFFFVISNIISRGLVWWGTYWHHADVPRTNVYDSSFTCTNKFLNTITFNNGYHTVHHEKPTLHWTLLPQRTEQVRDKIPDICISDTIPN